MLNELKVSKKNPLLVIKIYVTFITQTLSLIDLKENSNQYYTTFIDK